MNFTFTNGLQSVSKVIFILHSSFYFTYFFTLLPCFSMTTVPAGRLAALAIEASTIQSEIIPHLGETITKYTIRYIRKPKPIILCDLSSDYGNVSINGESSISECELNPSIHEEILQRAVELAKSVYIGDIKSTVELGQRAE